MFIGHVAVGLATKKAAPRANLGALMAAPLLLDLLWPLFLIAGLEQVRIDPGNTAFNPLDFLRYPYSHSLAAAIGWATLYALLYLAIARYRAGARWIWLGVVSHWLLDAVTHRPDLPLTPGDGLLIGFGLWNYPAATIIVELGMFAIGVWLYASTTRAVDRIGRWGFRTFVAFFPLIYTVGAKGTPPPNIDVLIVTAMSVWIVLPWTWWFDRHRALTQG